MGIIGFFASLILLIVLTMRGVNIILAALLSTTLMAITNGLSLEKALTVDYMQGFTGYFASWFLVYLLGAVFGKVMEETGAAASIAAWVKKTFGAHRAVFATVAACAIMTYGGVSIAIVAFTVYPIAVALFREANLPHRFIPAALVFGSISFTMTSPGSPEIKNLIPMEFFGTQPTAGGWIGFAAAAFIAMVGGLWLKRMVDRAIAKGEEFDAPQAVKEQAQEEAKEGLPSFVAAIAPLALVIIILNIASNYLTASGAALLALLIGSLTGLALALPKTQAVHGITATGGGGPSFPKEMYSRIIAKGSENAIVATANICAVVGFGAVAQNTDTFKSIVDALVSMPGLEYAGLAAAVTIIAGITGSASGGLGIALPILAPLYGGQGLDPGAMHRISALAAGGLDSMPHNGYIVTTIRAVSNETHERAYKPIFVLSVIVPMIALTLAVILYTLF